MRIRKWLLSLLAIGLLLPLCRLAQSAGMNEFDQGQLVPLAVFNGSGVDTAVGIMSGQSGTVHWAFYDTNGNRRHNGSFAVLANRVTSFLWSSNASSAPSSLSGVTGYLLFVCDSDSDGQITGADGNPIAANAFQIDLGAFDVVYVPTVDVDDDDLASATPSGWTNDPIIDLDPSDNKAPDSGDQVDIQYFADGAMGGDDSIIYIWSDGEPPANASMTIYDGAGASKAISIPLPNNNLNPVDLESNAAFTGSFPGDGFLRWTIPNGTAGPIALYIFTVVKSDLFNAAQTLLIHMSET